MPGWNSKGIAAYGLVLGLAGLGGLQTACHKASRPDNLTQPPQLSYQTPTILPTVAVPFTSVAPDVQALVFTSGVGTFMYTGFTFTVLPPLPGGLTLDRATGIISGTPSAVSGAASYSISADNTDATGGGATAFGVTLGVQAASPVTLAYAGNGAASTVVGGSVVLNAPIVGNGTATGFGVSPALPAGLVLNPGTGFVSGSPTTALAPTQFTLTVTTPTGCANATFGLLVAASQPVPPNGLAYPGIGNPVVLTANQAAAYTSPTPTLAAGNDLAYTVAPALPAGLSLDPFSGVISGIPAAANAGPVAYTVTASNAGGFAASTVNLTVNPAS